MDLGPHAAFIWTAYAVVALVLAGLVGWLWLDGERQKKLLGDVEAEGGRRRGEADRA